jgi:hypothetical protein
MGFFSKSSREERFWEWFAANSQRYLQFDPAAAGDHAALFDELQARLNKVHRGLAFMIGVGGDDESAGRRELVISADGIKERFPAVERLVAAAPELPDWKIIAFRPRGDIDGTIDIAGFTMGPENLWFRIEPDSGKVGLHLYIAPVEGCEAADEAADLDAEPVAVACFLLLDNALGEYDVETKIGFIERHPLPEGPDGPEREGLRPFSEIPAAVDAYYKMMNEA